MRFRRQSGSRAFAQTCTGCAPGGQAGTRQQRTHFSLLPSISTRTVSGPSSPTWLQRALSLWPHGQKVDPWPSVWERRAQRLGSENSEVLRYVPGFEGLRVWTLVFHKTLRVFSARGAPPHGRRLLHFRDGLQPPLPMPSFLTPPCPCPCVSGRRGQVPSGLRGVPRGSALRHVVLRGCSLCPRSFSSKGSVHPLFIWRKNPPGLSPESKPWEPRACTSSCLEPGSLRSPPPHPHSTQRSGGSDYVLVNSKQAGSFVLHKWGFSGSRRRRNKGF